MGPYLQNTFVKEFPLKSLGCMYLVLKTQSQSLHEIRNQLQSVICIWDHAHSLLGSSRMTVCTEPASSGKQEQISGEILLSFRRRKNIHFLFSPLTDLPWM